MRPRSFRADLLPKIRDLEIEAKQNVLSAMTSGEWISRLHGRGIEFAGYRQYTSGDDASLIDWRASVRSRKLLIKQLQEERDLNIYLLLDVSDTMLFGTTDKVKSEYVAELTSSLAFAALHAGENVSLTLFADRVHKHLGLNHGVHHHTQMMRMLTSIDLYGGRKDFVKSASQLLAMMRSPGLIIVISDFIGFETSWEKFLKVMAAEHDLICVLVRDPRDRELPARGMYAIEDPSGGSTVVIDVADYAEPYKEYVQQEEAHLAQLLKRAGADFMPLQTSENFRDVLTRAFLKRKQRWWLD